MHVCVCVCVCVCVVGVPRGPQERYIPYRHRLRVSFHRSTPTKLLFSRDWRDQYNDKQPVQSSNTQRDSERYKPSPTTSQSIYTAAAGGVAEAGAAAGDCRHVPDAAAGGATAAASGRPRAATRVPAADEPIRAVTAGAADRTHAAGVAQPAAVGGHHRWVAAGADGDAAAGGDAPASSGRSGGRVRLWLLARRRSIQHDIRARLGVSLLSPCTAHDNKSEQPCMGRRPLQNTQTDTHRQGRTVTNTHTAVRLGCLCTYAGRSVL